MKDKDVSKKELKRQIVELQVGMRSMEVLLAGVLEEVGGELEIDTRTMLRRQLDGEVTLIVEEMGDSRHKLVLQKGEEDGQQEGDPLD